MTEHIKKAHPDHINLAGMDVRYFGNLMKLLRTAALTKTVPMSPMELLWVIRMEKLANRTEFIDIENEPQLPRLEPEPEVLPALDVLHDAGMDDDNSADLCICEHMRYSHSETGMCVWVGKKQVNCNCKGFQLQSDGVLPFEDDGGYTGPVL